MKHKRWALLLLCLTVGVASAGCSGAGGNGQKNKADSLTESITFSSENPDETKDEEFEKTIKRDGKTYELKDITYKQLKKEAKEREVKKEVKSEVQPAQSEYEFDKTIEEDGITYTLQDVTEEAAVYKEGYVQAVTGYTDYSYAVTEGNVPATKTVTAANDKTGQMENVTCDLAEIEKQPGEWQDTYIDIVYETYDADTFIWGNSVVGKNEAKPEINEAELLASVGGNTDTYKIEDVYWTGNAYENGAGVLCRNAKADVKKLVTYYRAKYRGEIRHPEEEGKIYTATYSGKKADGSAGYIYEMDATAEYTKVKSALNPWIVGGVGVLILAALVTAILLLISRRKKEKEEGNERVS